MLNRISASDFADLFLPVSRRKPEQGAYFVRVTAYGTKTKENLWKFHEAARVKGVVLEGQITNPDERQLGFLNETLGCAFQADAGFVASALAKWMPRLKPGDRTEIAKALCSQFEELRRKGKSDSILKNIYAKVMCWLYYRFERIAPFLGDDDPPRILYESSSITAHELILLRILGAMGADILLLESLGDQAYLKQDPGSDFSQLLNMDSEPFPKDFSLKILRKELSMRPAAPVQVQQTPARPNDSTISRRTVVPPSPPVQRQHIDLQSRFPKPSREACTNAWMKEADFTEILTPVVSRGDDFRLFYNAFIRMKGVPDRLTYMNELLQFYQKFRNTGRNIVIVDEGLSLPDPEETAKIRRHPYRTAEELILDLAGNLPSCANVDLQRLMQQSFVCIMEAASLKEPNLNRLVVSGVYILCWIQRYQAALFQGYKGNEIPCFVLMGGCRNMHDALFIQFLSRIPVDVLILACDLNRVCTLQDEHLLELTGNDSLTVMKFPKDAGSMQIQTSASNAEQDLTSVLYTDSGLFRDRQFSRADSVTLRTTYDEIFILWDQELKYRSNFSTVNQAVNMPVIFAKVSGVEKGKVDQYWQKIKQLLSSQTKLFTSVPLLPPGSGNPYQSIAVKALRNGKLNRAELKASRQYPFGLLREELQEHIFDKIQLMLDSRMIRGTFENGTEYTVAATVLNLPKDILRMLQSFDFTKKNPKIVAVCTGEQMCTAEDAILLTFLNLVGFDVVLFVPTGYQTIERWLNESSLVEHQAGDYIYDLRVPDFNTISLKSRSWIDNLLKRGN